MAVVLIEPHAERELEIITSHSEEAASVLTRDKNIAHITSDSRFVLPFEQTMLHGLFSGEHRDNYLIRKIKIFFCNDLLSRVYEKTPAYERKRKRIKRVIGEIFKTAYRMGNEFGHLENLRNLEGSIERVSLESGTNFVYPICDGLQINVPNRKTFSGRLWKSYAQRRPPQLFIQ